MFVCFSRIPPAKQNRHGAVVLILEVFGAITGMLLVCPESNREKWGTATGTTEEDRASCGTETYRKITHFVVRCAEASGGGLESFEETKQTTSKQQRIIRFRGQRQPYCWRSYDDDNDVIVVVVKAFRNELFHKRSKADNSSRICSAQDEDVHNHHPSLIIMI